MTGDAARLVMELYPRIFGGTWTYEVTPAAAGSSLRIREDGEISNPVFRFLSRFVFGYSGTMDA